MPLFGGGDDDLVLGEQLQVANGTSDVHAQALTTPPSSPILLKSL